MSELFIVSAHTKTGTRTRVMALCHRFFHYFLFSLEGLDLKQNKSSFNPHAWMPIGHMWIVESFAGGRVFNHRHLHCRNSADCQCLLAASRFRKGWGKKRKKKEDVFQRTTSAYKLEPSMANHFSKDLFLLQHKVSRYWKYSSQSKQPQTRSLTLFILIDLL